ncbi:MAG: box helicase domain protein [Anaerosporomusa subterranea]|nr:box helicase domain protein [Anaerosporomusa subterranea]
MNDAFTQLGVGEALTNGLQKAGITQPTGIQTQVIPLVLAGKDVIGQSATGTGKTLAYLLPLFHKIDSSKREMQALVLAPTYELAMQIQKQVELLAANSGLPVTSLPIIGDVNIVRQIEKLREKPHIIVGSSGRIMELIQKRKISAHTIKTIVLDEGDRLLGEQLLESVKAIIKTTLKDRQLLLFSATIKPGTVELAKNLMREPEVVRVTPQAQDQPDITHWYFVTELREKMDVLRKIARSIEGERALVFINKQDNVEVTVAKLNFQGLAAAGLHGSAGKAERKKALEDFRNGKIQLLIASDIAARGLDIPGVDYVINLDMPDDAQTYLHRAGRTGRAGHSGTAISIVTVGETQYIEKCEKALKITMQKKQMVRGEMTDKKVRQTQKVQPVKVKQPDIKK